MSYAPRLPACLVPLILWLSVNPGCALYAMAERDVWRTHTPGTSHTFSADPPEGKQRVFHYIAFGDSIASGFDVERPTERVQSYADDLAITLSRRAGDVPVHLFQYAYSGRVSADVLESMRKYAGLTASSQLITWEAGGNDFFLARLDFRNRFSPRYCRMRFMQEGLDGLRTRWTAMKELARAGDGKHPTRRDAVIRAMNAYYPEVAKDREAETACTDADTGIEYASAFEAFLPLFASANWHICNDMYVDADPRLACADAFAQFNLTEPHRARASYRKGEPEPGYLERILLLKRDVIDASQHPDVAWLQSDHTHPNAGGHLELERLHELPARLPKPAAHHP